MPTITQVMTQGDEIDRDRIRQGQFPLAFTPRISIGNPMERLTRGESDSINNIVGNQFGFQLPPQRGIFQFFGKGK
ncbi:hypothetical protein LCGC14_0857110 [marine sediment metagenome]|uniref:Uncharacterized protein n=1 Tax=marine sediment metagenome TaxID=412755 RepID=A0A0F9P8C4_9ZZZZ